MKKELKKILVLLLVSMFVVASTTIGFAIPVTSENALRIHDDAIVIDTHNDTMTRVIDRNTWLPVNDIGSLTSGQLDIPKMEAGGLDVAFFGSYTGGYTEIGRAGSRFPLQLRELLHRASWRWSHLQCWGSGQNQRRGISSRSRRKRVNLRGACSNQCDDLHLRSSGYAA